MKKIPIIFIFTVLVVCFGYFVFNFFQTEIAIAGPEHNVSGFAWSENIGWISFNNTSGGGAVSYGVNIDSATGNFSGYAWSENIGWIQFNPSGPYPGSPNYSVKIDLATKQITGWARALANGDGWDGWIKFGYGTGGSYIDDNGDFHGWAWGSDVVGWISLNHANTGGSLYKVSTAPSSFSYTLTIDRDNGTGSGTVTSNPSGINCGSTCAAPYSGGTVVTLFPSPSPDSLFMGWSGDADCSDGQVTMNVSKTCIATFDLRPPDFSLVSTGGIHATLVRDGPPGTSSTTTIKVIPNYGFNSDVNLSVQSINPGLPGAIYNFTDLTLTSSEYSRGSDFSVTMPANTLAGAYTIVIKGVGGGLERTVTPDLILNIEFLNPNWREF